MPTFKAISQRKWNRGLQATYGTFAQPDAILTRLFNMVYTRRGALITVDGSQIFTKRNGALQPNDGPILEMALYAPIGVPRYYMGIQRSNQSTLGIITDLSAQGETSGDTITSITRSGNVTTLTGSVGGSSQLFGTNIGLGGENFTVPFLLGDIMISGTTSFNRTFDASIATYTESTMGSYTISYPDPGIDTTELAGTWGPAVPLPLGTYIVDATLSDGAGGETLGTGAPVSVTLTGSQNYISASCSIPLGAAGFNLYITGQGRVNPSVTNSFPRERAGFLGALAGYGGLVDAPGAVPPTINTTTSCVVWRFDTPSYTVQLGVLPSTAILPVPPPPGGGTGSGAGAATNNPNATPQGGVTGALGPTPQFVPFQNDMMMAVGNGYPPQFYPDGGSVLPIPNNFSAIYPDWEPNTVFNVGDNIVDSVSGGVFNCTQGGESGGSRPAFNNTLNAGTADSTVVWKCTATKYQGQPLRGAAHMIVYAGSLWLANTSPSTTSDEQDGPSCIKMSDLNNFKSWNPVNVAMVNRDDGDQITGLAQFTIAAEGIAPSGNLIVFKNFSTYEITGVFGGQDFSIQQSKTDMGCIASRSIQFLAGFGAIGRLTHLGFALFDGVNDKVISEEIRPFIFGDPNQPDIAGLDWSYIWFSKGSQSSNPPMYLCACPILPLILQGVTAQGETTGTAFTYYIKVTKLASIGNGEFAEISISNEIEVQSGTAGIIVSAPAINFASGERYNVYVGTTPGGESLYQQANFLNNTTIAIPGTLMPGTPSIGAGALTRIFGYDLVQKTWTVIDLPFPISAIKQIRTGGTQPLTIVAGWSDAALRRMFAGDTTWDGEAIDWILETAELYQEGGSGKVFYRKVVCRGSSLAATDISIAINISGKPGTRKTAQVNQLGPAQWDERIDIMADGENANAEISGTGPVTIDSLDWFVKAKPAGAPVSAQKR